MQYKMTALDAERHVAEMSQQWSGLPSGQTVDLNGRVSACDIDVIGWMELRATSRRDPGNIKGKWKQIPIMHN